MLHNDAIKQRFNKVLCKNSMYDFSNKLHEIRFQSFTHVEWVSAFELISSRSTGAALIKSIKQQQHDRHLAQPFLFHTHLSVSGIQFELTQSLRTGQVKERWQQMMKRERGKQDECVCLHSMVC